MTDILHTPFLNAFSSVKISLKFVPKGSIDDKSALVQVMLWTNDDADWLLTYHLASMRLNSNHPFLIYAAEQGHGDILCAVFGTYLYCPILHVYQKATFETSWLWNVRVI